MTTHTMTLQNEATLVANAAQDEHDARDERSPNERPVREIAPHTLTVRTRGGEGEARFYASDEWLVRDDAARMKVTRVVILIHGRLRNADVYASLAMQTRERAGKTEGDTLLLVPQFLATADAKAYALPASTLHWEWTAWMGGDEAVGPARISSFDVLDALLAEAIARFPQTRDVVVAGHSGGAQVAHRYAVLMREPDMLRARDARLRFVIANPSSYVYFDALRPRPDGSFAPFDVAACPGFDHWKYGLSALPDYARAESHDAHDALEKRYAHRDVTLLLGDADCDPQHPALDRSCAAMAQGPHRLARGRAYARYMAMRHPDDCAHRCEEVAGVGHDADGVFASAAGVRALFGD